MKRQSIFCAHCFRHRAICDSTHREINAITEEKTIIVWKVLFFKWSGKDLPVMILSINKKLCGQLFTLRFWTFGLVLYHTIIFSAWVQANVSSLLCGCRQLKRQRVFSPSQCDSLGASRNNYGNITIQLCFGSACSKTLGLRTSCQFHKYLQNSPDYIQIWSITAFLGNAYYFI